MSAWVRVSQPLLNYMADLALCAMNGCLAAVFFLKRLISPVFVVASVNLWFLMEVLVICNLYNSTSKNLV